MIIRIIRYIRGYVRIRVAGYAPERFLNLCANRGILIWELVREEDSYTCYVTAKSFMVLNSITRKTKTTVQILEKHGMFFFLRFFRRRKLFFVGIGSSVAIFIILSFFIWDITISGNYSYSKEELLTFLKEQHIEVGSAKSSLSGDEIVRLLRTNYPDIVWASVQIKGTRLFIDLRENETTGFDAVSEDAEASDILASSSGTVTAIVTRKGTPYVKVGDTVEAGQLLVQGRLEITGDDGTVVDYQYCHADADITIQTSLAYSDTMQLAYQEKIFTEKEKHHLVLSILGKQIDLGFKVSYEHYESNMKSHTLQLGSNFYLPVTVSVETFKEYNLKDAMYSEEVAVRLMGERLEQFCADLEKKGVQILEKDVKIECNGESCIASGNLVILNREQSRGETEVLEIQKEEELPDESGGNVN